MLDLILLMLPLSTAVVFGFLAAKSRILFVRIALVGLSALPPLAQWYALIWYRRTFWDLSPMLENKARAVTAGICQMQTIAALTIALSVFLFCWTKSRSRSFG